MATRFNKQTADVLANTQASDAASELMASAKIKEKAADDNTKSERLYARINKKTYQEFDEITKKLNVSKSAIISTYISMYVREHRDLLD